MVFAFIFVLAFTSVGYLGIPGWWKYTHEQVSPLINDGVPTLSLWPPVWGEHPFGQDRIGRDLFAMTMRGAQQSITIMIVIGLIAGLIGVVVGAISGYFRGWAEAILMRVTDVIIIIPALLLAAGHGAARRAPGPGKLVRRRSPTPTASWPSGYSWV